MKSCALNIWTALFFAIAKMLVGIHLLQTSLSLKALATPRPNDAWNKILLRISGGI